MDKWFPVWGVSFGSEGRMCTRAKELVKDHLIGEYRAFSFPLKERVEKMQTTPYVMFILVGYGSGNSGPAPEVYRQIPLCGVCVIWTILSHQEQQPFWYHGRIPSDEI